MKRVAIIGTQGVPAHYGGFETLAENLIGEAKSSDIEYTVICSSKDLKKDLCEYKGARLLYVGLRANGVQSIPYDIMSMCKVLRGYDVILILGISGCIFLPFVKLLSKTKIIVNIDGLEHRRDKWGKVARWFLKLSESIAVKYADIVVADNKGIQDYVMKTYNRTSALIAYGGDQVIRDVKESCQEELLKEYDLQRDSYYMSLCRIEPENNCHIVLEAFAESEKTLVFIGNWDKSEYGTELKKKYVEKPNIRLWNAIYDLDTLYILRNNCSAYIHGHSAGGTNPSLVEAMFFGKPILAFNVVYNKATTYNKASYFSSSEDLVAILKSGTLCDGGEIRQIAQEHYTWQKVVKEYETLYHSLLK